VVLLYFSKANNKKPPVAKSSGLQPKKMNKNFFLTLFLLAGIVYGQETLHVDFETVNADIVFNSWNSSSTFSKVENPNSSGINTSSHVGQFTSGNDNGIGIGVIGSTEIFQTPFDLSNINYFKMKVWSEEVIDVTFHLENNPDWGNNFEVTQGVFEGQLNQWVELTFDFSDFSNANMNNIVLKISGANTTEGDVYYFDDIVGSPLYPPNTSTNPASGATGISVGSNLKISTNSKFKNTDGSELSDLSGAVSLKIGGADGTDVPFTASINDAKNVITLDPSSPLENATTYWYGIIDNALAYENRTEIIGANAVFTSKEASVGPVEEMLFDFDQSNAAVEFSAWDGNSQFEKIANPDPTGINTSENVAQFTAGDGAGSGGGWSPLGADIPSGAVDFTETPFVRVKIWTANPITLTFKFENNPTWQDQAEFSYTLREDELNQWTEVVYNFGSVTLTNQNKINLYFDGARNHTTAGTVYYFDEIKVSDVAPAATFTTNPTSGATEIPLGSNLQINTNLAFRDLDGIEITDFTEKVALKTNDANGADVSFTASINESKNSITLDPTENLSSATTYWFGILDGTLETSEKEAITSVNATFTTKAAVVGDVVETLFDFDTTNTAVGFESWGGTGFAKIANPDATGINTSNFVGEYTHAGNDSGLENSLVGGNTPLTALDFSETPYIRVKVWVNKPVSVMVRIQNYPDYGKGFEQSIEVTEVSQWVQLIYNFSSVTASNYDRAQIYFDRTGSGESLAGDTYYFDDYEKTNIAPVATFTTNPVSGTADFAVGRTLEISTNLDFRNLDDSDITDLTGKVALKTNNANGTSIPFTAAINETKNTITLDPETYLEGETTYWFGIVDGTIETSNNTVVTGVSAMFTTKVAVEQTLVDYETFEGGTNFDTWLGDECDFDTAFSNPFQDGNNSSATVFKYSDTGGQYANVRFDLEESLDLSTNSSFSFMVYVPSEGISGAQTNQISLKLQDGNAASPWETQTQIDKPVVLDQWQEITFDFANDPYVNWISINTDPEDRTDLNRVVLQMNGENNTDQVTAYIDNIKGPKVSDSGTGNTDFSVPANNFRIAVTGETCLDKGNGKIGIIAIENNTYNATIDDNTYPFVDNALTIENLASGSYTMCISVANQDFESCFAIEVAQGETLKAAAKIIVNKIQVEIEQGTAPYTVYLNEKVVLETYDSALEIEGIHYGDRLEIKTGIACEGSFTKTVATIGTVTALPNPTNGSFEIGLATEEKEVVVSIYNLKSKLLSRKPYPVNSGKIQLNLEGAPSGLYLVKVNAEETITLKIVKH